MVCHYICRKHCCSYIHLRTSSYFLCSLLNVINSRLEVTCSVRCVRYYNVMMKMRRVIEGVTRHFTTQFDFDEVIL